MKKYSALFLILFLCLVNNAHANGWWGDRISKLADVDASTAFADGQVLIYDAITYLWTPDTLNGDAIPLDTTAFNNNLSATDVDVQTAMETIDNLTTGGTVSDEVYGATWDNITTIAPSKNAVYDKIQTITGGSESTSVSDTATVNLTLTGQDITADFLPAGVGAVTWCPGAAASYIWGFNVSGTDTAITFGSGTINVSTGALQVGGTAVLTAEVDGSTTNEINTITLPDANATAGLGITFAQSGSIAITESAPDTVTFAVTEADPTVDTEAEIEAITGALFGASKAVTAGYVWVADGIDFESCVMSGDVTIASGGATTIADSVAVTSWNLTTPTITTSLTTSTPTTLSAAELDRLDGLTSAIIDDDKIDTFAELDAIVADKTLVETTTAFGGDVTGNIGATVVGNDSHDHSAAGSTVTINAADIVDKHAGTDITADLEEEVTEGSLADSTILTADIKDGEVAGGDINAVLDLGGKTSLEIPNTAGDVTCDAAGEIAVDSTQGQLVVFDSVEIAIPLRHMISGPLNLTAIYDVDSDYLVAELDATVFPDGIVITGWELDCSVADPTTEIDANLMYCDDNTTGVFPGANPVLIDVLDTTTGNSSCAVMSGSDLGSGVIPSAKMIYIDLDADPVDATTWYQLKIKYYVPES